MSARDVIAKAVSTAWCGKGAPVDPIDYEAANEAITALTTAGWTLAPPGSRVVPEGAPLVDDLLWGRDYIRDQWHGHSPIAGLCLNYLVYPDTKGRWRWRCGPNDTCVSFADTADEAKAACQRNFAASVIEVSPALRALAETKP